MRDLWLIWMKNNMLPLIDNKETISLKLLIEGLWNNLREDLNKSRGISRGFISWKYNIFTQVVGGRAPIRSELVGKDDAYEYI